MTNKPDLISKNKFEYRGKMYTVATYSKDGGISFCVSREALIAGMVMSHRAVGRTLFVAGDDVTGYISSSIMEHIKQLEKSIDHSKEQPLYEVSKKIEAAIVNV